MGEPSTVSSFAFDLTRLGGGVVSSFYSNLVTRPTGRAVRMGVESQLAEMRAGPSAFLSVLDFAQVNVLDYSCADEIVAKLLLANRASPSTEAFFIARGLRDHHLEAVAAVLERHELLLVAQDENGIPRLLGPSNPFERACWSALARRGRATIADLVAEAGLPEESVNPTVGRLAWQRVLAREAPDRVIDLSYMARTR